MPPLLIIKLIGGLLGSVAGLSLLYGAYNFVGNYFTEKDNLRIQMCNSRIELEREHFEHKYAKETWAKDQEMRDIASVIRAEAETAIAIQREKTNKYKKVLEDRERLERLAKAKPGLMTRRVNAAIQRESDALAEIYNIK